MSALITFWFGSYLITDSKIKAKLLFPREAKSIAERLFKIFNSEILDEELTLVGKITERETPILVLEPRLTQLANSKLEPNHVLKKIAELKLLQPLPSGYNTDLLHKALIIVARNQLAEALKSPDRHITQAVNSLDEIQKVTNLLAERLIEWYNIYACGSMYHSHELDRRALTQLLQKLKAEQESEGGEQYLKLESNLLMRIGEFLLQLYKLESEIKSYIKHKLEDYAPNLVAVAGVNVASRLIASAGSLQKLARFPSSTIQVLGAEKALFQHLRTGSKCPKHGIIYQHPSIYKASQSTRGKLSRSLASKIVIAARADAITNKYIADEILGKNSL